MLRHAVFALVLIGASFAGGAAMNGPGLTWLQRTVLGGPSIIVDGPQAAPGSAPPKNLPKQFPTARTTPQVDDLPPAPEPKKKPAVVAAEPEPLLPPESPSAPAAALIRPAEAPGLDPDAGAPPALAGSSAPPAHLEPPPRPAPMPKTDPVARLASAESPSATPAPAEPSAAPDWAEIRRRMRALGIARYTLEAETGGRVRVSCIIPLDGLRAVGQQFEGEGDDETQALEAALRRVTLWQATEAK